MKFEQVCQTLHSYFSQNQIGRVAMPISVPLMLVCAVLRVIGIFLSLGSIVNTLAYILFFFFLILTLSCCNFRMAAVGLGICTLSYLCNFLSILMKYKSINYSSLIYILVYGFFAYMSYKKSLQMNQ